MISAAINSIPISRVHAVCRLQRSRPFGHSMCWMHCRNLSRAKLCGKLRGCPRSHGSAARENQALQCAMHRDPQPFDHHFDRAGGKEHLRRLLRARCNTLGHFHASGHFIPSRPHWSPISQPYQASPRLAGSFTCRFHQNPIRRWSGDGRTLIKTARGPCITKVQTVPFGQVRARENGREARTHCTSRRSRTTGAVCNVTPDAIDDGDLRVI